MGTQSTGGGSTTSFTNTPQAQDDTFGLLEDFLGVTYFDVMGNDLGGNAKTLFSLDNGTNNGGAMGGYIAADLLVQDTGRAEATSNDTSANGAKVWITSDGKVGYDAATLSAAFKASLQSLGEGQFLTDTFIYAIRMANGTLSWATATVRYSGVNDVATISIVPGGDYCVTEAGGAANSGGDNSAHGQLTVNDVDSGQNHFQAPPAAALNGTYGTFTFNNLTGQWTYTLDDSRAATQALNAGQVVTETLHVVSVDGTASKDIIVTVKGANDNATIAAAPGGDYAVVEAGGVANGTAGDSSASGQVIVSDVDAGQSLFQAPAPASLNGTYGTFTFNASTGQWTYTLDNSRDATQKLNAGDAVTETLHVVSLDGTASSDIVVNVAGTNDAPVAVADSASVNEDAAVLIGSVATNDSDVDDGETATLSYALDAPVAGLTLNPDGSYSFDPSNAAYQHLAAGATVEVVATYTVTDVHGATDTATLTITVTGVNDAPVAGDDVNSATEDGALVTGSVAGNDSDADDSAALSYALNAPVAGLTLNADGSYSFDPSNAAYQHLAAGATTDVVATYTVSDGLGGTDTATLTITVTGINDAPVAGDDVSSATEDGALVTGSVAGNDSDADDGAALSYALNAPVAGLTLNPDGSYSFDPSNAAYQHLAAGATTDVIATYTVNDGLGGTDTATLTITVTGVNDAPVAGDDVSSATEDGAVVTGSVAGNDSDADDGAALSYSLNAPVAGLTFNPDGSYSFDPSNAAYQHLAAGATTDVVATYTVSDGLGGTDTATLTITVTGVNDAPVAGDDVNSATEDGSLVTGSVAGNDSDADDGAALSYSLNAPVAGLTLNADGSYSFDPSNAAYQHLAAGATTDVIATYTVSDGLGGTDTATLTITVIGINDAPVAGDDVNSATEDGSIVTGSVAGNDSDADDGAALSYSLNAPVAGLTLNPDGSYSFDPSNAAYQHLAAGATTDVVATYTVSDGLGGTDIATLTITVTGVNDAPVAGDDVNSATEDGSLVTGSVAGNDSDADDGAALSYSLNAPVAGLTLNPDGSYSFDPSNAAYQHLAAGATTDVIATYTVSDGLGGTDIATLTITVTGINDAPVAGDDVNSATEDGSLVTGSVAGNDSDADDGAALSYALNAPVPGLTLNPNGSYSFDPSNAAYQHLAAGATTDVVATYTVSDGLGGTDIATLTITVTGINDAPVAADDSNSATEDGAIVTGSVAGNDSDADDGAALSYALIAPVAGLTLNPDGSYSFDPSNPAYQHLAAGATTDVVATYTVSDGLGGTDTATLTITVTGINDAPVAGDDVNSATEDGSLVTGSVAGNDSDADDGAALSYALNAPVAGLTLNADGSYSFDPSNAAYQHLAAGATTDVVATYTVSDGLGGTDTATLTITVTGINDAPVAGDDVNSATEDGALVTGSVAGNDSDADDGETATLNYTLNAPVAGLILNANGSYSFNPADPAFQHLAAGATANVVASYTVTDAHGANDTATLTITVTGINDAASISAVAGGDYAVVEAGGVGNGTPGDPNAAGQVSVSDVDDGENHFLTPVSLNGTYGTFTFNTTNGQWTYVLDNSRAATQALNVGSSVTDTLNVTSADGTATHPIIVNITGANDAAIISGTSLGSVVEAGSANAGGTPTASGTLTATDVDNPANTFTAVAAGAATANHYGTFAMTAGGTWTYTLDNSNAAVNALNNGQQLFDSFVVTSVDGTQQTVNITINGANDVVDVAAPTDIVFTLDGASGNFQGNGLNAGDSLGALTAVDVDSTNWTFTLGGTNAGLFALSPASGLQSSVNLLVGGANITAGTYTFTVTATDGAGHSYVETFRAWVGTTGGDAPVIISSGTDLEFGLNGGDTINGGAGDDALIGGQGNDTLDGGAGFDQLVGGGGGDVFKFSSVSDSSVSNPDKIFDFDESQGGEVINLQAIDAIAGGGDNAFAFAGQTTTVSNNSVNWFQSGGNTFVQGDVNGDGVADFTIMLVGNHVLTSGDFVL